MKYFIKYINDGIVIIVIVMIVIVIIVIVIIVIIVIYILKCPAKNIYFIVEDHDTHELILSGN